MKNYLFLLLLCPFLIFAQEQDNESSTENPLDGYKKWNLELGVGVTNVARAWSTTPTTTLIGPNGQSFTANSGLLSGYNFNAGLRYNFNDKFGVRLKGLYATFSEDSDASNYSFDASYLQVNLEAVFNVGNFLDFYTWTDKFNLQMYAGPGYGHHFFDKDNYARFNGGGNADNVGDDNVFHAVFGFTPMYKLSDNITLKADFQTAFTFTQHVNWDGAADVSTRAIDGLMFNASVGINIALGEGEKGSIDWYYKDDTAEMNALRDELDELEERVAALEVEPEDEDNDGVPDVINNYVTNYVDEKMDGLDLGGTAKSLVEDGYIRLFFDFNKDMPNASSTSDLASLVHFLENNPDANVELIGMTDVIGSDAYNDRLSQRRAKNVHDILVEAGIDSSRLEHRGNGENPVYTSKNEYVRMLARTVTVKLQ
jgi:OOP family OmpA-OmpF porin